MIRYTIEGAPGYEAYKDPDGEWVRYEDMQWRTDRLRQRVAELEAENAQYRNTIAAHKLTMFDDMKKDAERYRYCIDKGYLHSDYAPNGEYWDAAMEADK